MIYNFSKHISSDRVNTTHRRAPSPPSVYNSFSKIAPAAKAFSTDHPREEITSDTKPQEKHRKESKIQNKIKEFNQNYRFDSGSTFSHIDKPSLPTAARKNPPSLLPKGSTDMYLIDPDCLPVLPSPPEERPRPGSLPSHGALAYPRNKHHGLDDWRNQISRVMNKDWIEEFEHEVIIASNQQNLEQDLEKKPEGTYLIHKGASNKNMAYPYTIYRCVKGNFARSQVIKNNIRFDLIRKTYQAEGYGTNHPTLRDLVNSNKSLLKREMHER